MKVLFVTHYSGFGGANQSCIHLMRLLRERHGVESILLSPRHGIIENEVKRWGIRCDILRYASWRGPRYGCLGLVYGAIAFVVNSASALVAAWRYRNERIDIVHSNSSLAVFGWFYAKLTRKPFIWHLREYGTVDYPMNFYYGEKVSGRIYGTASAIVAISDDIAKYYGRFVMPKERICTIFNGIDILFAQQQMRLPIKDIYWESGVFKLLFLGGINKTKNPFEVVKALAMLKAQDAIRDIHFYVVGGGDEAERKEFDDLVAKYDLQERVHCLGFHKNVWPIIAKMDLCVVPSVREAFGRIAVECMICALPVIAANTGGLPEVVLDGETGFIYKQGDVKELAEKILLLHEDEGLRRRLGQAGLARATNLFGADSNADRVFDLYGNVMGKGK